MDVLTTKLLHCKNAISVFEPGIETGETLCLAKLKKVRHVSHQAEKRLTKLKHMSHQAEKVRDMSHQAEKGDQAQSP